MPYKLGRLIAGLAVALSALLPCSCLISSPTVSPDRALAYFDHTVYQPTTCNSCHSGNRPTVATQSLIDAASPTFEYMNHTSSYAQSDCVSCHTTELKNLPPDTTPPPWSRTVSFHSVVSSGVSTCTECHGTANGNPVAGNGNTIPGNWLETTTASSVGNSGATITPAYNPPPSGQPIYDGISHTDANVAALDCNSCHSLPAAAGGSSYSTWTNAMFHSNVTSINTTSGKCANCHFNILPNASYTNFNHETLLSSNGSIVTPAGRFSSDCGSCHTYLGTGTTANANWLGAVRAPALITVGGFTVPNPPANPPTTQSGIANLPHPAGAGAACTSCHTSSAGNKPATGYDHASNLINGNCSACHEYGSDLVATGWPSTAASSGSGDTRPVPLTTVSYSGCSVPNSTMSPAAHWYGTDCSACHSVSSTTVSTSAGGNASWGFNHSLLRNTFPSYSTSSPVCAACHSQGCEGG